MKDGKIGINSEFGKEIGFTDDKFSGWLWKKGNYIYVSFIESKQEGKGNLSKLFNSIQAKGFGIKVPTPFSRMESIIKRKSFVKTHEMFEAVGEMADVWVKESLTGSEKK